MFELCRTRPESRRFTYQEIPEHYVWDSGKCIWKERKKGQCVGRLNSSHYTAGELWYLRMLLCRVKGPTCFSDLGIVDGITYNTFQEACAASGLLNDDNEWHEAILENVSTTMPNQLRSLFVHIIVNCQVSDVLKLWKSHWRSMADDILPKQRNLCSNPKMMLSDEDLENYTLRGNHSLSIVILKYTVIYFRMCVDITYSRCLL